MPNSLLSLPSSLLLLLSSSYLATAEPWPYNLPKHEKYWPEHEEFVKRDAYIQQRMAGQSPAGVQKMSSDPGEKFYLGYWQFEAASAEMGRDESADNFSGRAQAVNVDADEQYSNASLAEDILPPLLLHSETPNSGRSLLRFLQRNLLEKRDFQCPTGTNSCANIDRPNSCCPSSETCVIVEDTGLGDVGCCPAGGTCSGGVSSCNTAAGYTSCPDSDNGGCCIPGYTCQDVGYLGAALTRYRRREQHCHYDYNPPPLDFDDQHSDKFNIKR
ncbi:gpi anchored protein [Neofusicoccum parvum]|nr:gpi anchored protein [Neofusicoccum parvum]